MVLQRRLFCQTRFSLQILSNGVVNGTKNHFSKYAVLDFIPEGMGLMYIQGVYTELYLCMSHSGKLYTSKAKSDECKFIETLEQLYNTYHSAKYSTMRRHWHVALSKTGKARLGNHSGRRQRSSRFLKQLPTHNPSLFGRRTSPTRHSPQANNEGRGNLFPTAGRKRQRTKGRVNRQRDKRKRHRFPGGGAGDGRRREPADTFAM